MPVHKTADQHQGDAFTRKPSILVVDDEPAWRKELRRLLEGRGFAVTTAKDGAEAIAKVEKDPFDLVLLDYLMPGMDGLATFKRLLDIRQDIWVVMLTGVPTIKLVQRWKDTGIVDFITKSMKPGLLIAAIYDALKGKLARDLRNILQLGEKLFPQGHPLVGLYYERAAELYEQSERWELAGLHFEKAGSAWEFLEMQKSAIQTYTRAAEMYRKANVPVKEKRALGLAKSAESFPYTTSYDA